MNKYTAPPINKKMSINTAMIEENLDQIEGQPEPNSTGGIGSDTLFSIAREYGEAGTHLELRPHGYPFPIVLPVITKGSRDDAKAWTWNGSTKKPTLKPSVKTTHPDGTVSHIWLTDGMCQHLSDSTDGLAGQTLPLQHL